MEIVMRVSKGSLKIAMTSFYLPSESKIGAGWAAHRLANAFINAGHKVTMWSPTQKPYDAAYEHVHVPIKGNYRLLKWPNKIRALDFGGFDALICHGDDHLINHNRKIVHIRILHGSCFYEAIHVRGWREKLRMIWLGVTELISSMKTPIVVGVSRNSIKMYPWLHEVIPNSVDLAIFRPDSEVQKSELPSILFVGTCDSRKNGSFLKEVFNSEVKQAVPNAQLWMVCRDCKSVGDILVTGEVSTEELVGLYRKAWVFCLPSTYEGFGIPYIEAMACGTPIVATPNPGSIEILHKGEIGVIVRKDELGLSLIQLLTNENSRTILAEKGIARSKEFSDAIVISQYEEVIYKNLISI